jgi:D-amino-acid dehydrogenase
VVLGAYSHAALKDVVRVRCNRISAASNAALRITTTPTKSHRHCGRSCGSRKYGVDRRVVSSAELFEIEPAFKSFAHCIVGGNYTASEKAAMPRVLPLSLAQRCSTALNFVWALITALESRATLSNQ